MTVQRPSSVDNTTPAERARHRVAITRSAPEPSGWLATMVRPAGRLDAAALRRLSETLSALAASCDMVVVDLNAIDGGNPREMARSLRGPALRFELAGRCLLLVGPAAALTAELDRLDVPVVTLAADALPLPAPAA